MHVSAVNEMYVIFCKAITCISEFEFYFTLEYVNYLDIIVDMPWTLLYLQYLYFYRQIHIRFLEAYDKPPFSNSFSDWFWKRVLVAIFVL